MRAGERVLAVKLLGVVTCFTRGEAGGAGYGRDIVCDD